MEHGAVTSRSGLDRAASGRRPARGLRRRALVLTGVLTYACAQQTYHVETVSGGSAGASMAAGLTLQASPGAWRSEPRDLGEYLTPVWLELSNHGARDVRVDYADFALVDEHGFRFAAINPYTGNAELPVTVPEDTPEPPPSVPQPSVPQPSDDAEPSSRAEPVPDALGLGASEHASLAAPPRVSLGARFYIQPRYYPYDYYPYDYYPYYQPWPYEHCWPYCAPYAYVWDYRYYASPRRSQDIARLALAEGVLQPDARVSGFVYFQKAASRAGRLDLVWSPRATDGRTLATLRVALRVVED